jgi:iron complex transport system substrate-binding protein
VRVVSLTCSNTEIVCALGLADLLVGVDDHSDFPPEVVARLPRVGPDLQIDLDAVEALKPDLVLASLTVPGHERIVDELARRKVPFLAPEPVSLADVYRDVQQIGAALGASGEAERVVAEMVGEIGSFDVGKAAGPTVLVEWWPKPVIIPGRLSWVNDLIAAAGGRNPLGDRAVKSAVVTDEEVLAWRPDAVVIAWCGVPFRRYRPDVVARRPAWQDLPALTEGRIHCVSEAWLGRPGPRLVEGYRALRSLIAGIR